MNEQSLKDLAQGALLLGIDLSPEVISAFSLFGSELKKWNIKTNLTAITSDVDIAVKHFLDSLTLLKIIGTAGSLLDIGTGAGFPSLPLKIAVPSLQVVSVDAVQKKIIFQRHVARLLGLTGFDAIHVRGEELPLHFPDSFDWVVSRAFSDLETFARIALPMISGGGGIIAMKGSGGREEAAAAKRFLEDAGLMVSRLVEFSLPMSGALRTLIEIRRC